MRVSLILIEEANVTEPPQNEIFKAHGAGIIVGIIGYADRWDLDRCVEKPKRIYKGQWVVIAVPVPVDAVAVAYWVGLEEAAGEWIIVPGAVIVKANFDIEPAAGEHVGIWMVGVFCGHLAVDAVLVGLDGIAAAIAEGHHRAEGIVVIVVDGVTVGHLDHADGLVDARAVDVFAQQRAAVVSAVVFGDYVAAVVAVSGDAAVDVLFDAPGGYEWSTLLLTKKKRAHTR